MFYGYIIIDTVLLYYIYILEIPNSPFLQADTQGSTCGDLLVEKEEMASLLTEPLEELINRHGAFPDDRRVSWKAARD